MKSKGFTLIELLIVVAIIAILAAIAIPNFLAAQVRAKVTKSKSEMRNLATALESYALDYNQYPEPMPPNHYNVPNTLSSPIAYITNVESFYDPFSVNYPGSSSLHRYGYLTEDWSVYYWFNLSVINRDNSGKWHLDGFGPTQQNYGGWPNSPSYDPTNGTVSNGAIYRTQKDPEGKQI